jgi:hypothetical protein
MVDFGMRPCVLAFYWVFYALPPCHFQPDHWDLFSHVTCLLVTPFFLELCLVAVIPVAVACAIDAMVCICDASIVHGV